MRVVFVIVYIGNYMGLGVPPPKFCVISLIELIRINMNIHINKVYLFFGGPFEKTLKLRVFASK